MRLLSAKITGFRSFGRTVKVTFEPGLNCVLGPDGCGKTSFLEALLWVFGASVTDDSPEALLFRGSKSLPNARGALIEVQLAEAPWQNPNPLLSRFSARDHRLSHYRINDVTRDGDVFPDDCSDMIGDVLGILDVASLEAAAIDPPKGKILILDELDRDLSQEDFRRLCDSISKLRDTNQIILASHRKEIMRLADHLIGVTMEEYGVSKTIGMRVTADAKQGRTR